MIELIKAELKDSEEILYIQKQCFIEYLDKYQDHEVNPCNEDIEHLKSRIESKIWDIYFIKVNGDVAGIIKVNHYDLNTYKINDFGILPKFRDMHIGTAVFMEIKEKYDNAKEWILSTILEEDRCIHFYEKFGFKRSSDKEPKVINEKMTIVGYKLIKWFCKNRMAAILFMALLLIIFA